VPDEEDNGGEGGGEGEVANAPQGFVAAEEVADDWDVAAAVAPDKDRVIGPPCSFPVLNIFLRDREKRAEQL